MCYSGSHDFLCPNKILDRWFECDMVSVTKSNYINEFEIKISKSDFKQDFKKTEKHACLRGDKTIILESGYKEDLSWYGRPNYFWYVCPENLIPLSDIPSYAGLMYALDSGHLKKIKKAPLLHREKISEEQKVRILRKFYFEYWNKRIDGIERT